MRVNLDWCRTHFGSYQLYLCSCAPSYSDAYRFSVHNLQPYFISVASNILDVCAPYFSNLTMYSRFVAFQWRLICSTCNNSPIGATILTSIYCYGNLTGLTSNCVVLWKGKYPPASISMAPKHSPYPSSLHTFQWRPDHFSGVQRLVVYASKHLIAIIPFCISSAFFIAFTRSRDLHVFSIRIAYFAVFQ